MSLCTSGTAAIVVEAVRPALLDFIIEATNQKDHRFKDFFSIISLLEQFDVRSCYYDVEPTRQMKRLDTETYMVAPGGAFEIIDYSTAQLHRLLEQRRRPGRETIYLNLQVRGTRRIESLSSSPIVPDPRQWRMDWVKTDFETPDVFSHLHSLLMSYTCLPPLHLFVFSGHLHSLRNAQV
ncbi:hypothetical protein H4582DRAFT_133863 [Lactarius indigo]|nr:hypothetical protein H4582DRAFT_133863 [Lactarius indigo]